MRPTRGEPRRVSQHGSRGSTRAPGVRMNSQPQKYTQSMSRGRLLPAFALASSSPCPFSPRSWARAASSSGTPRSRTGRGAGSRGDARAGHAPFVNDAASGGQPLLANPNAVLLYPTVLLEKVVSPAAAFNLHYLLHVLWAFFGAAPGARLGLSGGAAFFGGAAFAFSGMMLSYGSAFANAGAAAAWLPWCAAAAWLCRGSETPGGGPRRRGGVWRSGCSSSRANRRSPF